LSVNLSPKQFTTGELPSTVEEILSLSGFPADRLVLEVTERLILRDEPDVQTQIEALQNLGAAISVDEFGVGHASLSYLWQFKFDRLKIDRALIGRLTKDDTAVDITRTIVELGHSLGMKVTAEGIETQEQLALVQDCKCDFVQVFYLAKPERIDEISSLLINRLNSNLIDLNAERNKMLLAR